MVHGDMIPWLVAGILGRLDAWSARVKDKDIDKISRRVLLRPAYLIEVAGSYMP